MLNGNKHSSSEAVSTKLIHMFLSPQRSVKFTKIAFIVNRRLNFHCGV